jgi:AcrR family transcriptional regulator
MTYVMTTKSTTVSAPPRDRMVESAALLLRERGLARTGMRDVAERANAPRGSLQHYFPGGKEQVVTEALDWVAEQLDASLADPEASARDVIGRMFGRWRKILERTDYLAGCPIVATIADASGDDVLRPKAAETFARWRASLATALRRGGLPKHRAERLAVLAISALEGAIVLARADRNLTSYLLVAQEMDALVATALPEGRTTPPARGRTRT